jgi:hypothetical protein
MMTSKPSAKSVTEKDGRTRPQKTVPARPVVKDEGGRMKDEVKAVGAFLSSFILPPHPSSF